jgi:hypothetical protein
MPRKRRIILAVGVVSVIATTWHLLAVASPWVTGWELRSPFENAAPFHLRMLIWHGRETKVQAEQGRHAAALVDEGEDAIPVLTDALLEFGLNPRFHPQPLGMLGQLPRAAVTAEFNSRLEEERPDRESVRLMCGLFEITGELTHVRDALSLMEAEHARVRSRLDAEGGGRPRASYAATRDPAWPEEFRWIVIKLNDRYAGDVPRVSESARSASALLEWVELKVQAAENRGTAAG